MSRTKRILKNNQRPIGKGASVTAHNLEVVSSKLPSYVKCCVCGKPPIGSDWLKPVNPSRDCRVFVHLSHIPYGPGASEEAGFILRNS